MQTFNCLFVIDICNWYQDKLCYKILYWLIQNQLLKLNPVTCHQRKSYCFTFHAPGSKNQWAVTNYRWITVNICSINSASSRARRRSKLPLVSWFWVPRWLRNAGKTVGVSASPSSLITRDHRRVTHGERVGVVAVFYDPLMLLLWKRPEEPRRNQTQAGPETASVSILSPGPALPWGPTQVCACMHTLGSRKGLMHAGDVITSETLFGVSLTPSAAC